jgi:RNA polymerase sigma-70 factor (ECF subfamily)
VNETGPSALVEELLPDYERLKGFFRREVGCQEEAADLTQETYTRLLRWKSEAEVEQPRSLLFRIARNLLVDRSRILWRRTRPLTEEEIEKEASPISSPAQSAETVERLRLIQQAVAQLPERCREVFILSRFGGHSYGEIAILLGIAPSTVEKHMIKALAACKAALDNVE